MQRNAGTPFFHRMGASRLERTICTPAQDAGWRAVMGRTPGPSPEVARESDLVVLWGINAVATNLHFVQRAKEARRRGGRVLLIDTYPNDTAAVADAVYPGAAGLRRRAGAGLIHLLAREGLADERFLAAGGGGLARAAGPGRWPSTRRRR